MTRFQFVADHQDTFEVKRMCQVLDLNRSSFYAWQDAAAAREQRAADDEALAARIRAVQKEDPAYGAPRVTAELNEGASAAERVNHKRVARVMREKHLPGLRLRRRVRTTIPAPAEQAVPDLLKRDFTAPIPGIRYVGDITYLPIADGSFLYLATVIDCCSRALVGWAIAEHMRTSLVTDALHMAAATRGSLAGATFHSDHGAQGGFNWSSQHLGFGGVWQWRRRIGKRKRVMCPRVLVGSGVRTERCALRCGRPGGLSPHVQFSGSSGDWSRRVSPRPKRR